LSHSSSPFSGLDIFERGSRKIFAHAGFKSWSSLLLLPE
jgi:hypothetical protein